MLRLLFYAYPFFPFLTWSKSTSPFKKKGKKLKNKTSWRESNVMHCFISDIVTIVGLEYLQ